jgi:hypothetical protein
VPLVELGVEQASISLVDDELGGVPDAAPSAEPCALSRQTLARLQFELQICRLRRRSELVLCASGALFVSSPGMEDSPDAGTMQGGLTDQEKRDNVVRLAFGGRPEHLEAFCRAIDDVIPPGTIVVLRGSAVTGHRWKDQAPFDADGPGTSDLDLTLVGSGCLLFFKPTGFFVPGIHSRPLSDEDPDIAPGLVALRDTLMAMVKRPVNIQASRDVVLHFRGDLLGQPYLVLFEKPDHLSLNDKPLA